MNAVDRHLAVTSTALDEIARAISELRSEREFYGAFLVSPENELKTLRDLFRQRAVLLGEHISGDLCQLAALFIFDAMLAQEAWDLKLFRQSQAPFGFR